MKWLNLFLNHTFICNILNDTAIEFVIGNSIGKV